MSGHNPSRNFCCALLLVGVVASVWPVHGVNLTEGTNFWAFRPVLNPPIPQVSRVEWPRSPIDYFILAKLEEKKLSPVQDADKRTLIRRATFDLIGLPPTPPEMADFLNDTTSEAFAKVVDRLLASPHYGERWGRHWLDVVRYADTAGETADFPVPEAYRYRNYVIDSFNSDKPYAQFIQEQIAGDILAKAGPREKYAEQVTATGYLAISRRFGFDIENYEYLTIEDTIGTLGTSILGLTLGCARCHDHKYDPISTADYYALYGIFSSSVYAYPGCEEKKYQRDFVPLIPEAEVSAILKPYKTKFRAMLKNSLNADAEGLQQLEDFKRKAPQIEKAYGLSEGKVQNARIQIRGDPKHLGDEVPRGFLKLLGGQALPPDTAGSGRLQLANWLTSSNNPLTARVMVNRIWQKHFGAGLVRSVNNFGHQGRPPTHPELLDYLATRFVQSGGSIKAMHRLIMLSRVYQLSSRNSHEQLARDPDAEWYSSFSRHRLDAEALRDAVLMVSGELDQRVGGGHPFPSADKWKFTQHEPFRAVYENHQRSVYLMVQRIVRHPYLALFDGADPNACTGERAVTTTPLQALYFLNDAFIHEQSDRFADRLLQADGDDRQRIQLAYQWTLGRVPTETELHSAENHLRKYVTALKTTDLPPARHQELAWASYARVLFSCNEFNYVD